LIYVFDATTPTSYSTTPPGGGNNGSGGGSTGAGNGEVGSAGPMSPQSPGSNSGLGGSGGKGASSETEWERDVKYFEECLEALYSLAQEEQLDMLASRKTMDSSTTGTGSNLSSTGAGGSSAGASTPVLIPPRVWVLVNKMDIVGDGVPAKKLKIFEEKRDEIERRVGAMGKRFGMDVTRGKGVRCFGTSIWDESLYKVS